MLADARAPRKPRRTLATLAAPRYGRQTMSTIVSTVRDRVDSCAEHRNHERNAVLVATLIVTEVNAIASAISASPPTRRARRGG